jgi:defect in organelle trafficking protein DotA
MKRLGSPLLAFWLIQLGLSSAAYASSTAYPNPLNFTPPSTDYSMVFLANIFGVVDGVLAGTGSQIMGAIFGVFNSAVLALGGIVLLYTLTVATLNTAHQGEILGKSWSSIWVPMRTVLGVGLLLPKASGYCTMQIFVMWVVVQGVGAADKIWGASLEYLQRGGVLVQAVAANNIIAGTGQTATSAGGGNAAAMASQATGAAIIATQQNNANSMLQIAVCLHMMQHYANALNQQAQSTGQCNVSNPPWYCSVPQDLMAGADFIAAGSSNDPRIQVPSVTQDSLYFMNGLCGTISWSAWTQTDMDKLRSNVGLNVDPSLLAQAAQGRTIAVQQMWMSIDAVANAIVSNRFVSPSTDILPLGVSSPDGITWSSGVQGVAPLLSGTEMSMAAASYLGIMAPTLNALSRSIRATTAFIDAAKAKGWIMAGTYFFNLASLNAAASGYASDNGSVTVNSVPAYCLNCLQTQVPAIFTASNTDTYSRLMGSHNIARSGCQGPDPVTNLQSVSTYLCNTNVLKSLGQLGTQTPQFIANYKTDWQTIPYLPEKRFSGGFMGIPGALNTIGYMILRIVLNLLIQILNEVLAVALDTIFRPIIAMTIPIFTAGLESALANYTNPIIALAQVGNKFINVAVGVWMLALVVMAALSAIPGVGTVGVTVSSMIMPFLGTWLGAMFTAGCSMAFYIPLLPYMLFTFGAMGWFIAVIESMAAAPLVALGVTMPEGDDVIGKASPAVMLLMNVFLRPGLMVIGFITGIILAYVGIWLLNTGFQSAISGLIGPSAEGVPQDARWAQNFGASPTVNSPALSGFAGMIGIIFLIVIYITMYISIVKLALEKLMFKLADDILTWLSGGQNVPLGAQSAAGAHAVEGAVQKTAGALEGAAKQSQVPSGKGKGKGKGKDSGASGGAGKGGKGGGGGLQSGSVSPGGGASKGGGAGGGAGGAGGKP